jgi:hypothetical protein
LSFRDSFIHRLAGRHLIHLMSLALLIAPFPASAGEITLVPSIIVREDYNDNIHLAPQDQKRDFITGTTPALSLNNRTEMTDMNLKAAADGRYYARYSSLNALDPTLQGNIRHQLTHWLAVSANAGYSRNSSTTLDLEETGLAKESVTRERVQGGFTSNYILSDKATTVASYNFSRDRYNSDKSPDLEGHIIQLSAIHDLDSWFSRTKGHINLGYDQFRYSSGILVNNYSTTVGFTRDITETVSLLLDAGGRYGVTNFDLYRNVAIPPLPPSMVKEQETNTGWGWTGQMVLSYKGEKGTMNLSFGNNISPASGFNGTTERMSLMVDMKYQLTYDWSVAARSAYITNKSDQSQLSITGINQQTWLLSPSTRYEFTKDFYLDVSYSFNQTDNRQLDTTAAQNIVMVMLTWKYPEDK